MKKLFTFVAAFVAATAAWADVEINEAYFPDENFRQYLLSQSYGEDGVITDAELQSVGSIVVPNMGIQNLSGIQYFTKLWQLICRDNELTWIDVTALTELTDFDCQNNQLYNLNLSYNQKLLDVHCENNQISFITAQWGFSPELRYLNLSRNQISAVNMNEIIGHLPDRTNQTAGSFQVFDYDNASEEGNVCLTWQVNNAAAKNWSAKQKIGGYWEPYVGAGGEGIAIDEENFPDENFRLQLLRQSYGHDGFLSDAEIQTVTELHLGGLYIKDLKGIEHFKALTTLDFSSNQLTTAPDLSQNTELTTLSCNSSNLTALDLTANTKLEYLYCSSNQLTTLDLTANTKLKYVACYDNQLTELKLTGCADLYDLRCSNNKLAELDLSDASELTNVECYNNLLAELDLSGLSKLDMVYCNNNQLTSLKLGGCSKLHYLTCTNNQLTELDLSDASDMQNLYCNDNKLEALDLSHCPHLRSFYFYHNQIKSAAMYALMESLHDNGNNNQIYVNDDYYETELEGNECTEAHAWVAVNKGWEPYHRTEEGWVPYIIPTAITTVAAEGQTGQGERYTLSGRKARGGERGLMIENGRKVVVK